MKARWWIVIALVVSAGASVWFVTSSPKSTPPKNIVLTAVMPHHDIVKNVRLEFWQNLDQKYDLKQIKKVFLLSPNHFGTNQSTIVWNDQPWQTSRGELANFLTDDSFTGNQFRLDNALVKNDHGVFNLIGELKQYTPNAAFAPILLGQSVDFAQLSPLLDFIRESCAQTSCLVFASVDFSHYATLAQASQQDQISISHLQNLSITKADDVYADSPQALYVIQEFAKLRNFAWHLYRQTNSAGNNPDTTDTTSHVFGWYQ
jgi:AmmeMemoRadiSam system protein B